MDALIIIGLAAVIAIAVVWSRVGLVRSEKRSMRSYKHTLEVLGDVSRRSDKAAPITPLSGERATFGHIRTERTDGSETVEVPGPVPPRIEEVGRFAPTGEQPVPRARLSPSVSEPTRFEDDSDAFERIREEEEQETLVPFAGAGTALPAAEAEEAVVAPAPARRPADRPRPPRKVEPAWGRIGSVAAGVIILVALVLVGIHFATNSGPGTAAGTSAPTNTTAGGTTGHHHQVGKHPATTTIPSALVPVSTSSTDVAFVAPKGTYTVQLTDTGGTCWVGIQQTSGGPYVWQETLNAGQTASYRATGPLVVRIGAPKFLGVKVNGIPARLPGYVQPYDLTFNPSSPPSSA